MSVSIEDKHKQENEELEKKIAEMLSHATGKNEKKRLNKEAEKMRRELFEKQQQELVDPTLAAIAEKAQPTNSAEQEEKEKAEEELKKENEKKKKRKNAKAQRERKLKQQFEMQAAAMKIASEKTPGQIETEKLEEQVSQLGFQMKPIVGDGHCLFRAVSSCLASLGKEEYNKADSYMDLRKLCADEIRSKPDFYLPFSSYQTKEELEKHCDIIEKTAEWGDALEVSALANALHLTIIVHSLGLPPQKYGDGASEINISFHSKYSSEGGHYNSLIHQ